MSRFSAFRAFCTISENAASTSQPKNLTMAEKALQPLSFLTKGQLTKYLSRNVLAHAPGRFVIIPKPYGVSCIGHGLENGGIFENSVYDDVKNEKWRNRLKIQSTRDSGVTISDCIKELGKILKEPNLMFCTGLKRYISGAIVLPCNEADMNILRNSIRQTTINEEPPFLYNALAITIGKPERRSGSISGFATFRNVGKHKEYIFEERKVKNRAKTGKYAVEGSMRYNVLDSRNDLSLIEFSVNKFARHLPRLMLTQLVSPILGDTIYWRRIADIDGNPELISAGNKGHKIWIPKSIGEKLEIEKQSQLLKSLPMYCHVYKMTFENVGGHEEQGLIASSRPPRHFMKMLELLGFLPAYKEFKRKSESVLIESDDEEVSILKSSGETKF